jgi:hypothetical protein
MPDYFDVSWRFTSTQLVQIVQILIFRGRGTAFTRTTTPPHPVFLSEVKH